MNDENWKKELIEWNPKLKPYQIKLLEEGAQSNNQTLILSDMWLQWKDLATKKKITEIQPEKLNDLGIKNPINSNITERSKPCECIRIDIDDQLLRKVKPLTRSVKGDIKQLLQIKRDLLATG